MLRKKLFIGVLALGLAPLAFANGALTPAAPTFTPSVYAGIQGGYGMTGMDIMGYSKENGLAGRIFAGYNFHKNFAVEGGFTYWFNQPKITVPGLTLQKARVWALDLVGVIKAEVMDNVGIYAKAGVDYLHTTQTFLPGTPFTTKTTIGNVNVVYGVGATYSFTPNIVADASWTRYNGKQKASSKYQPYADLFAIGVRYCFNLS